MGAYFCSVYWVLIHLHCKRTNTHTNTPTCCHSPWLYLCFSRCWNWQDCSQILDQHGWYCRWRKQAETHAVLFSLSHTDTHTTGQLTAGSTSTISGFSHSNLLFSQHLRAQEDDIPNHRQDKTRSLMWRNMHSGLELELKMHSQFNSEWPTTLVYTVVSQTVDLACHSVHWNDLTNLIDWNKFIETRNSGN